MNFDEKHPDAPDETFSDSGQYPQVVKLVCEKVKCNTKHTCIVCQKPTFWMNLSGREHVCSEECNNLLWNRMVTMFVVQQALRIGA